MYPENLGGTQVIIGSMNMRYISDTARNRTHNLFRPKWEPIPLGHSNGHCHHYDDLICINYWFHMASCDCRINSFHPFDTNFWMMLSAGVKKSISSVGVNATADDGDTGINFYAKSWSLFYIFHHHHFNVHFLSKINQRYGRLLPPTAKGRQPTSSNTSILRFLVQS